MPLDPIIVSYSELDTYRQCPLKHRLAYVERWTRDPGFGSALSKGSLWHMVMQAHYTVVREVQTAWLEKYGLNKREWANISKALQDQVLAKAEAKVRPILWSPTGTQDEEQALVWWMYQGYVEQYGVDLNWWVLGIEVQVVEPLRNERGRKTRYHLKTKIDLMVYDLETGGIWVVDHKSGANLPNHMDLEIDDQFGLYTVVMRWHGIKVRGQIHNAARTTRNLADFPGYSGKSKPQTLEQRMRRTYLHRTDKELTALALDALAVAMNAHPAASRALPLYSSPDPRQCGWKCDFKEAHLAMRGGTSTKDAMGDFDFHQDFTRH